MVEHQAYRYWDHWLSDGRVPRLFIVDVRTRRIVDLFAGTPYELPADDPAAHHYDIAPDGRQIAFTFDPAQEKRFDHEYHVVALDLRAKRFRMLTKGSRLSHGSPSYSPDGRRIALLVCDLRRSPVAEARIALIERETGRMKAFPRDWDRSVNAPVTWDGDSASVVFLAEDRARTHAFRWGAGLTVPVYRKFQIQAEVVGTNYSDADFKQINPVDFVIGPVFYFSKGFFIRPAYSRNCKFEGTNATYKSSSGMNLSMGFAGAAAGRSIYVPPPPPPPAPPAPPRVENRPPTVSLDADKTNAITCDTVRFRANASDPDGDTLTYAWKTSAGRTVGEGANVTLEPGCLPAGTEVTVTVTVDDGHGHQASATRRVMIEEKPKPQTLSLIHI